MKENGTLSGKSTIGRISQFLNELLAFIPFNKRNPYFPSIKEIFTGMF